MKRKVGPGGGAALSREEWRERLAAYSRYAALIRSQEGALDEGDLHSFQALAAAREEMQGTMTPAPALLLGAQELDAGMLEEVRAVERELHDALHRDARLRARLARFRNEVRGEIRALGGRSGQVRRYLSGGVEGEGESAARLDVRL